MLELKKPIYKLKSHKGLLFRGKEIHVSLRKLKQENFYAKKTKQKTQFLRPLRIAVKNSGKKKEGEKKKTALRNLLGFLFAQPDSYTNSTAFSLFLATASLAPGV